VANRRRNWEDGVAGGTPLSAGNLNALEDDVATALDARVAPGVMSSGATPGVSFREDGEGGQLLDVMFPSGTDYGWLVACFTSNGLPGEKLSVFYSADGKTIWGGEGNPVLTNGSLGLRDPNVLRLGGKWFVAFTSNNGLSKDFKIAAGADIANLVIQSTISVSAIADLGQAWAPQFVVDPAAPTRPYIFFSKISATTNTGTMYWIQATNDALTSWTAPVKMAWTAEPGHYIDGAFIKRGNTWYCFYSTGADIGRATSSSLTGTYTTDKSGNWAGWGTNIEGPEIVQVPGSTAYRIYIDRYASGLGYAWSESTDLDTWTAPVGVTVPAGVMPPGTLIRHGSFLPLADQGAANSVIASAVAARGVKRAEFTTAATSIPASTVTLAPALVLDGAHSNVGAGELAIGTASSITMYHGGEFRISGSVVITSAPATTIRAFIQATSLTGYNGTFSLGRWSLGANGEDNYSFSFDARFNPGDTWKLELFHAHTAALTHALRVKIIKVSQ
jgi:hypothetical protein